MAKEVLVVGAGFGGLDAARALALKPGVRVTVVDQRNHHLFQPLLYQVATAGLNPADIAALIGFKNRISVFAQWVWSYAFSKRGARLITNRDWRLRS
jgi:2-polyprenyl-6-methoxyphenol hydroxylase-like FAD-dependent oxidoreductase